MIMIYVNLKAAKGRPMLKQHVLYAILVLFLSTNTFIGCSSSDDKASNVETTELGADLGADEFSLDGEFSEEAFAEGDFAADLGEGEADPFAAPEGGDDPFATSTDDPFAAAPADDPFAEGATDDPFASEMPADDSATAAASDPFAEDPFAMDAAPSDSMAATEELPADSFSDSMPVDPFASDNMAMQEPAPIEDMTSDLGGSAALMDEGSSSEEVSWIPVKKMMTEPYRKNGVLVNSIYIARPGDDIQRISQKIYGQDKTDELLMVSSWLKNGISVGDKLYYNSPNRSNDDSAIITYYEDAGLSPETYITQPGDNIRQVAERLLGHKDSWKEIWATNMNIDSKMEVAEGLELRYWTGGDVAPQMPTMASNEPIMDAPPAMDMGNEPTDMAMDMPMDEPMDMAMNDMPPPAMDAPPAMEPPPAMPNEPPPAMEPPPMVDNNSDRPARAGAEQTMGEEGGQDQMLMLGLAVILLIAGIALFIIRKKRSAEAIDFNTSTHTQIE